MTEHPQDIPIFRFTGNSFHKAFRFSHYAMATVFEIFIIHDDANYAQQAAWEAFYELDRLEQDLSRFIENSDISRINNLSMNQSVQIGLDTFECLKQCAHLYKTTNGAFDITIGSLLKFWSNRGQLSTLPSIEDLNIARQNIGMHFLQLDETNFKVRLLSNSICIDLGGFGKGYAIDQMSELLQEWEIESALIHGGSSSVLTLAAPPGEKGWPLTINSPRDSKQTLEHLYLQHRALSGSGLRKGRHIIDPRTGQPAESKLAAWAFAPGAATSDALSTAFMIMTLEEIEKYCIKNPDTQALVIVQNMNNKAGDTILNFGS